MPLAAPSGQCVDSGNVSDIDPDIGILLNSSGLFESLSACVSFCHPHFIYSTSFTTGIVDPSAGLSFFMITFTSEGNYESGRAQLFSKSKCTGCPLHAISGAVSSQVSLRGRPDATLAHIEIVASNGFTPWTTFNNTLASADAVNEFDPQFTYPSGDIYISEREAIPGALVFRVEAIDDDNVPPWIPISYEVEGNSSVIFVRLNGTNEVELIQQLDYENPDQRQITVSVRAYDNSPPFPRSALGVFHISLIDVNDNHPEFELNTYIIDMNQGQVHLPFATNMQLGSEVTNRTTINESDVISSITSTLDPTSASDSLSFGLANGLVAIGRVTAFDADSNTETGGNNSLVTYSIGSNVLTADKNPDWLSSISLDGESGAIMITADVAIAMQDCVHKTGPHASRDTMCELVTLNNTHTLVEIPVQGTDGGVPALSGMTNVLVIAAGEEFLAKVTTSPEYVADFHIHSVFIFIYFEIL